MLRTTPPHSARRALLLGGLLVAGSLLVGLPASAAATPPRPLIDLIHVENGTKDALEGGNYTALVVGNQVFGVLYGTADHPNAVTIFMLFTRSLGTATVTDESSGRVVAKSVTLPVRTLVAQRLDAAFEFRDLNGDGIFNFRPNANTSDPFDFAATEPLVKGARLTGAWNLTGFTFGAVADDQVNASLVLTLNDAPYRSIFDRPAGGNGLVDQVQFTVHLVVTRTHHDATDVPHFQATVERQGARRELTSLTPDGTVSGSYWSTAGAFKVDHDIVGWDFAPPRDSVDSKLLLHTTLLYVSAVDERLAPWLTPAALGGSREGAADVASENATVRVNATRPMAEFRPADGIAFADHWHRLGGLGWTPAVSVWANGSSDHPDAARARFQILGGTGFTTVFDGNLFRGFVLSGGFVYPSGYRILHDPELQAASVELEGSSSLPGLLPALLLLGEAFLIIVAAAGVLALAARASSASSRAQRVKDAERLDALRQRYHLPDPVEPPRQGGI